MPLNLRSRYSGLPVYEAQAPDKTSRATVAMRLTPGAGQEAERYEHLLSGDESVESLAWRYYGSSITWWRILDANALVFPTDMRTGSPVSIPSAAEAGRVVRTRSFG